MSEKRSIVRVMTWNIHGAVGRNPRFDLMRVVELIKRAASAGLPRLGVSGIHDNKRTTHPCGARRW